MKIEKQGHMFQLTAKVNLPVDLDTSWSFMSDPSNLKVITPDYMGFHIISGAGVHMFAGQIISYKVSPIMGIGMNWVTEISHVQEKHFFVDEQRKGPYAFWHHKHFLKPIENGTEMTDIVHYQLPLPLISNLFHALLVKPKLLEIFEYRKQALEDKFGTYKKHN